MSKAAPKSGLENHLTPIFNKEMGARLMLMRMKRYMDQGELGRELGVSQGQISQIEAGKRKHGQFSFLQLVQVLGDREAEFVVGQLHKEKVFTKKIQENYWDVKNAGKGRRRVWRLIDDVMVSEPISKRSTS